MLSSIMRLEVVLQSRQLVDNILDIIILHNVQVACAGRVYTVGEF